MKRDHHPDELATTYPMNRDYFSTRCGTIFMVHLRKRDKHSRSIMNISRCNTLGIVTYRRPIILICEVIEKLLSFLSDLATAIKMLVKEKAISIEREDDVNNVLYAENADGLGERKVVTNLPDLLKDLPCQSSVSPEMTLCNARPNVLPERCTGTSNRILRQNSNMRRRQESRSFPEENNNNGGFLRPPARRNYYDGGQICNSGSNTIFYRNVINNNVTNEEPDANVHGDEDSFAGVEYVDMMNGNMDFVGLDNSNAVYEFNQDGMDNDFNNSNTRYNYPMSSTHSIAPNNSVQPCQTNNNGNGSLHEPQQLGNNMAALPRQDDVPVYDPLRAHANERDFTQQARGSTDNLEYNNLQLALSQSGPADHDPHHEFTTELVHALRNIGDNLDTKLREQEQHGPYAVLGSTKINIGKLIVTALRHHNIIGVVIGASLEVYLLYKRL
ncbi:hypothetical protein PoB_007175100 [Plakobranchus ocellatus]|uniref:Uncharacterized protein n=1 Tax=Plakobranchus ocellatus TaxID=259542 RepID=A0AAV4DM56_9GAST|nr:hypothetical protein PoB_007175100 [Plakobranchus ocellatus]